MNLRIASTGQKDGEHMDLLALFGMQGTLFLLMLTGAVLKRIGIISEEGKICLSNLVIDVILPCTVIKAAFVEHGENFLQTGAMLLVACTLIEIAAFILNHFLYRGYETERRKVFQYGTIASMSGFLGTPIVEDLYGDLGILYAAIFLVPMRTFTWSLGTSYFLNRGGTSRRQLVFKVLTHPCLVAVIISLVLMITGFPVPSPIRRCIIMIGNCNSAIAMFVVGTILADVNPLTIVNRDSLYFCFIRLIVLPLLQAGLCSLLGMQGAALGVSLVLIGMPAATTTAIYPALYNGDAVFGTQCVVLSTLLSMVTLPLLVYIL
jgi:predicted permease